MNTLNNAQSEFVKNLLSTLEKNQIPWQATWDRSIVKPFNATSNKNYQGINELNLWMTAIKQGYDDPRWMTFKQANEKGYKIKKGSVGTYVFNYALRNIETKELITLKEYNMLSDDEKLKIIPFSKTYKVFNGTQIDGIPAIDIKAHQIQFENEKANTFVDHLLKNINLQVEQKGQKAGYILKDDKIVMPPKNTFMDEQSFYSVLLHETAHATSHSSRLQRVVSSNFGSQEYAMEELRAELTSAFLTLDVGFHFDQFHEDNHTAYIQAWIKEIKDNPRVIFDSIKDAQKIRDYMLDKGDYEEIYAHENNSLEQSSTLKKDLKFATKEDTAFMNNERFFNTDESLLLKIVANHVMYDDNSELATYQTIHEKEITSNTSFDLDNLEELFDINDIHEGVGEIKNCSFTLEEGWRSKCQRISEQEYNISAYNNELNSLEAEKEKIQTRILFNKNLESMEKIYNDNTNEIKDFCKNNGITSLEESEWDHYNALYRSSLISNSPECLRGFEKMYSFYNENYVYINTELSDINISVANLQRIDNQIHDLSGEISALEINTDTHDHLEKKDIDSISNMDTLISESINLDAPKQKQTVVIDLFGGPGAGKTTCAWEIAAKLKKLGYVAEYVPEYAKELVWDENMEILDGTLEHQQALLKEQVHRVDRLIGKVDFVVTDSPVLMNLSYLKEDDQDIVTKYEQEVLTSFNSHHNFSMFIKRGNSFETIGRIHNQEESIKLDQEIKGLLDKNKIFFGNYSHDTIDKSIDNCIKTYNRLNKISYENKEVEIVQNDNLVESTKEKKKQIDVKQIPLDDLKNSISIVDYARGVLGFSVIKEARGMFRLEDHDSCKIYPNNTFYRFSRSQGGSILDFIKHFEECDTKEAIEKMQEYYAKFQPNSQFNTSSGKTFIRDAKDMELPEKADTNKHVYTYLTKTRGIKPSIVQDYIDRKILYEDTNRNCVFVGKLNGTITYATLRSSNAKSTFKQDVLGSIKETGIYIDNGSDTLVVNEANIDQMSYMSMTENPKAYNYLSVCGAANCASAVRLHMVKRPEAQKLEKIIIGLDNDEAGEVNTFKTLEYIKENYPNIETLVHIPEANDFNDQLKNELNILASVEQDMDTFENLAAA